MNPDNVDKIIEQWHAERPDLDPSPMAILGRIGRLNSHLSPQYQKVFATFDLHIGEFDVLATLLRSGDPYTLTPNQLIKSMMLTSGAMTNRIDRLEKKQLVRRCSDPNDRRGVRVTLTQAGIELTNKAVEQHIDNSHQLLTALDKDERETLAHLLKKLLAPHETT